MWRSPLSASRASHKSDSAKLLLSPRISLAEVLRGNAGKGKNASSPALLPTQIDGSVSLNKDLAVLANVFPDVTLGCLREVLRQFDGDSRLEISTEQLYRHKSDYTKGQTQAPPRDLDEAIPLEESFRTDSYREACARLLRKEFSSLNKSVVDAVLAEVNYCYAKARLILQDVLAKSWRSAIWSILRRRKERDTIPPWLWAQGRTGEVIVPTGDEELDLELQGLHVSPGMHDRIERQQDTDLKLARQLNEEEAIEASALYECQICFSDVPFELVSACTFEAHTICLDCVKRSLNEAIFGQNWAQSVDPQLGTLKCLAPVDITCQGRIPSFQLKQAILAERFGVDLWDKFEERLAEKAILEAGLKTSRCPFCPYAEVQEDRSAESARQLKWSFRTMPTHYKVLAILACEFLLPTFLLLFVTFSIVCPTLLPSYFYTSLANLAQASRTTKFRCKNPQCKRSSCLKCQKPWHDPHVCHEPLLLSLRQSVEAARTNAVKRVCPRCGTAFVKSSGCNKLTCVCGYSMCYLCRKNIGRTGENEGAEGYRHFCEHFRPVAGQKCTQCEKCDLYKDEEEDIMVRQAGEQAEREWRKKQGQDQKDVAGIRINHDSMLGETGIWDKVRRGDWTLQGVSDWIVGRVILVKI